MPCRQSKAKKGALVRNDRFFMIPVDSVMFEHIKDINDFSRQHNEQLKDFFINYTKAENKKISDVKFLNASRAIKSLQLLTK